MPLDYTVKIRFQDGDWENWAKLAQYFDAEDFIEILQKKSPGKYWDFRILFGQEILKEIPHLEEWK